jgi:uncharacterized circularly permuted ATP-grasp superfamily protein
VVDTSGQVRAPYQEVTSAFAPMSPDDVAQRSARLGRAFVDQGVTFDLDGEERPFPLDVMPLHLSEL